MLSAPLSCPGPGARALYLGSKTQKHVTRVDESLVVCNEQAQTLRYPIQRVSRVVCSRVVQWSGDALALCMQAGISIAWVDAKGQLLGACYPTQRRGMEFATAFDCWLNTPDGTADYANWLRSRRMHVLVSWARSQTHVIPPWDWETLKRQWVYAGAIDAHLSDALQGLVGAYVVSQLAEQGLEPVQWDAAGNPINLCADLASLLWGEMNLHAGQLADRSSTETSCTRLFEHWATSNAAAVTVHLGSLRRACQRANYAP